MTNARAISRGQSMIYSGGFHPQSGRGLIDTAKKAYSTGKKYNTQAKKGKYVSRGASAIDALGLTGELNRLTGGNYSRGVSSAKNKGYGHCKRRRRY